MTCDLLVDKNSTMGDLLQCFLVEMKMEQPTSQFRLFEVIGHEITRDYQMTDHIKMIPDDYQIVIEVSMGCLDSW